MKPIAGLLIFLACWAQFDDFLLACAAGVQSAPIHDDGEEYIASNREDQQTRPAGRQRLGVVQRKPLPADFALVRSGVPSVPILTPPLAPPPVYVFMSLQR